MSLNARPSGAQKRKARNIRLVEFNKLRGSLDKFCSKIAKNTHVNTGNYNLKYYYLCYFILYSFN